VIAIAAEYSFGFFLTNSRQIRIVQATTSNPAKFAGKASCALELPIVPAISLSKSFKEVVKACQILNLNVFTFVPVGCFGGFGYYRKTAMMTVPVVNPSPPH